MVGQRASPGRGKFDLRATLTRMKQNVFTVVRWRGLRLGGALGLAACLAACALPQPEPFAGDEADVRRAAQTLLLTPSGGGDWQTFQLPGKVFAPFRSVKRQGRPALQVHAQRSVSVLRRQFQPGLAAVGTLDFSWKVDALPEGADLKDAGATDAPTRILLAFEGDRSKWNARTHRLSELSQLLTGEPLPYATLSYVWSRNDPLDVVLPNPRTDRIRKVVVESGTQHLGQWREYRRDVRADFIRAFGEEPGRLVAVALMTDTDNTGSTLHAWYGALRLVDLSGDR
jgi:Protein of unknown function (DUF3047)